MGTPKGATPMIRRSLLQSVVALAGLLSLKADARESPLSYDRVFDGVRKDLHTLRAVLSDNGYEQEEQNLIEAAWTPISVKADHSDKSIRHVSVPLKLTYRLQPNRERN